MFESEIIGALLTRWIGSSTCQDSLGISMLKGNYVPFDFSACRNSVQPTKRIKSNAQPLKNNGYCLCQSTMGLSRQRGQNWFTLNPLRHVINLCSFLKPFICKTSFSSNLYSYFVYKTTFICQTYTFKIKRGINFL